MTHTDDPIDRLRAALRSAADELRTIKRWWRTPATRRPDPPPAGWRQVHALKERATLLHAARAHARGRLHLRTWRGRSFGTLEELARLLEESLARMDLMRVQQPLLDDSLRAAVRRILETRAPGREALAGG